MHRLIKIAVLLILGFPVIVNAQSPFRSFAEVERHFNRNLRYPQGAMDSCQTGYFLMKFEVDTAGRVSNIEKMFGEYLSFAEEIRRVIQKSDGQWNSLFKSKNTLVLLPVYFKRQRNDDPQCDVVKPVAVVEWNTGDVYGLISPKQLLISNGIMLHPITVIGYGTQRKVNVLENTSSK